MPDTLKNANNNRRSKIVPSEPNKKTEINPGDLLFTDPEYIDFMVLYQNSKLDQCRVLIDGLLVKYPNHEKLIDLQNDLDVQISLRKIANDQSRTEKKTNAISTLRTIVILSSIVSVAGLFLIGVLLRTNKTIETNQAQNQQAQLSSLEGQANQLIQSGQPEVANEIIDRIRKIDPTYPNLNRLVDEVEELSSLLQKYNEANERIVSGQIGEALLLLDDINQTRPLLWDVQAKITMLQNLISINELKSIAVKAYQEQDWLLVVSSYEKVLTLSPALDDPLMKEQLFNAYLRSIVRMLERSDITSIEIEQAQQYYRKAIAMVPQNSDFSSERDSLQQLSRNLLTLKYVQTAKELLVGENQTATSVSTAVSFLTNASYLDPQNSQIQLDLNNAKLYQMAFSSFIKMDWDTAIEYLTLLIPTSNTIDSTNVETMFYESYYARGSQYYEVGIYLDARSDFEDAEKLAWADPNNLLKLFQVQIKLGETIGKVRDYQNAVSYYQYALNAIKANDRFTGHPELADSIQAAGVFATEGKYLEAFNLYSESLANFNQLYSEEKFVINGENCLAFFAKAHNSTVEAILNANNLSNTMVLTFEQELLVPSLKK